MLFSIEIIAVSCFCDFGQSIFLNNFLKLSKLNLIVELVKGEYLNDKSIIMIYLDDTVLTCSFSFFRRVCMAVPELSRIS